MPTPEKEKQAVLSPQKAALKSSISAAKSNLTAVNRTIAATKSNSAAPKSNMAVVKSNMAAVKSTMAAQQRIKKASTAVIDTGVLFYYSISWMYLGCFVYYTSPQCLIITFANLLSQQLWGLLLNFYLLVLLSWMFKRYNQ